MFDSIRALFRKAYQARKSIDVNELALETLQLLSDELREHGVSTHTELASELPVVEAIRVNCNRSSLTWSITRLRQWIRRKIEAECCGSEREFTVAMQLLSRWKTRDRELIQNGWKGYLIRSSRQIRWDGIGASYLLQDY